ncbi:MAG TPA: DDE-type integrase/transposase/recombinase [Longimicrobium sp.]|uniref:DDE-type integrase/transposase/recombinase n=1 Tax=Longimicrobium sp. TaxID=2029185 RepID=UPI002ED97B09
MPRVSKLTPPQRKDLVTAAESIAEGQRRVFAQEQAQLLGCHVSTIYRALEEATPVRGRKRRKDAGSLKAVDEDTFLDLAALTVKFEFDAESAIDVLNANRQKLGLAPVDITPATLRRQLAQHQVSRRHNGMDLRIHRSWQAPYSNHTHQFDSTVARCYYIDHGGSIGHETPEALNKNKDGNGRPRVWLIHGIDDFSRTKWGRFYTSEAAVSWRDLMLRAWAKPADPSYWPAYGLPEQVYSDQGSGLKSKELTRVLDELGVRYRMADPSTPTETNAQAKGKVERGIAIIQAFERFTQMKRFQGLDEMNFWFEKHLVYLNRREHSVTRQSPFHRWLGGMRDQPLRLLPPQEVVARMLFIPTDRRVSKTMTIELEGKTYQLPDREPFISYRQGRVPVRYRKHDLSKIIVVLDREEYEIEAVIAEPDVAGDFKSSPVPQAVVLKRELQQRDLSHLDPHLVHDYRLDRTAETFVARLNEVEHPLTAAAATAAVRMIRRGKAIDRLAADSVICTPPTPAERTALDTLFAGRPEIPEAELKQWIDDYTRRAPEQPHTLLALA